MRFLQNDPAKWLRRPSVTGLKSREQGNVLHHNTLNGFVPAGSDEAARSREVERFFDVMTPFSGKKP